MPRQASATPDERPASRMEHAADPNGLLATTHGNLAAARGLLAPSAMTQEIPDAPKKPSMPPCVPPPSATVSKRLVIC